MALARNMTPSQAVQSQCGEAMHSQCGEAKEGRVPLAGRNFVTKHTGANVL